MPGDTTETDDASGDAGDVVREFVEDGDWWWPVESVRDRPWEMVSQLGSHTAAGAGGVLAAVMLLRTPTVQYCAGRDVTLAATGAASYCQNVASVSNSLQAVALGVLVAGIAAAVAGDYLESEREE